MTENIDKEIPKVLSNQIYVCFVSDTEKLTQNIDRLRLLDTVLRFSKILSKLLIKLLDFWQFLVGTKWKNMINESRIFDKNLFTMIASNVKQQALIRASLL